MEKTEKTINLKDTAGDCCPDVIININGKSANGGGSSDGGTEDDIARQAAAKAQATADSKLSNITTKDSTTVIFYGDGTADKPLQAVSAGGVGITGQWPQVVGFNYQNKVDAVDAVRTEMLGSDFDKSSGQIQLSNGYNTQGVNGRVPGILTRNGLGYLTNAEVNISTRSGEPTATIDMGNGNFNITIPPAGITADNEPADGQVLMAKSNSSGGFTYHWTDLPKA